MLYRRAKFDGNRTTHVPPVSPMYPSWLLILLALNLSNGEMNWAELAKVPLHDSIISKRNMRAIWKEMLQKFK